MKQIPMASRYVGPRLRVGQIWFKVASWDYWYLVKDIDKYGNVFCQVWRANGTTYRTMIWAYQFDSGKLVFNKVNIKYEGRWE